MMLCYNIASSLSLDRWPYLSQVGAVSFYADLPEKHHYEPDTRALASSAIYEIITKAENTVIMQTPYLVMSRKARQAFHQ